MDTQKPLRLEVVPLQVGDSDTSPQGFFQSAYAEFPELRCQPFDVWYGKWAQFMLAIDRYLIKVYRGETVVGMAAVVLEDDPHVGTCLTVQMHYVMPAHRNGYVASRVLLAARRLAKQHGLHVLAYTQRVRDWTYEVRYINLKEERSG